MGILANLILGLKKNNLLYISYCLATLDFNMGTSVAEIVVTCVTGELAGLCGCLQVLAMEHGISDEFT